LKRVVAPDAKLREVDSASGALRYHRQPDGTFHTTDHDAKLLVQYGGFIQPDMGVGLRAEGFRCGSCGFGSWFKTCSKCGGECHRETNA
jgi:hypothetical protein